MAGLALLRGSASGIRTRDLRLERAASWASRRWRPLRRSIASAMRSPSGQSLALTPHRSVLGLRRGSTWTNAPVIVGVGQVTQRPETERPREPLALMAEAARIAERDAGAGDLLHETRLAARHQRALVAVEGARARPGARARRLAARSDLHRGRRQHAAVAGQRDRRRHRTAATSRRADRRRRGDVLRPARPRNGRRPGLVAARQPARPTSATRATA